VEIGRPYYEKALEFDQQGNPKTPGVQRMKNISSLNCCSLNPKFLYGITDVRVRCTSGLDLNVCLFIFHIDLIFF